MTGKIVPCCISNAAGCACPCHIPEASVLYDEVRQLRARLKKLEAVAKAAKDRTETFNLGSDATGRNGTDEWDALDEALNALEAKP
jgi:Na+-translocating ferredoxin:NAD+ oxidoreductase RnfC subunit